jgi:Divergent InlB B-repeat domain
MRASHKLPQCVLPLLVLAAAFFLIPAATAAAAFTTVNLAGIGTVTSSPAGIECSDTGGSTTGTCSAEFEFFGTTVELTATAGGPGLQFAQWSGNGGTVGANTCNSGTENPCHVANAGFNGGTYTATFESVRPKQTLKVKLAGLGSGEVTSSPARIKCPSTCEADFDEGSTVTLTAIHNARSTFAAWKGCDTVNAEGNCEVTMSAAKSVEAEFDAIPQQTLEVVKTGSGSGEVTSSPAGIECGATCTAQFNEGSTVILTATPSAPVPGSRYTFGGWKGCNTVTVEDKCEVTMSEAKTVEAEFVRVPQQNLKIEKAGSGIGEVRSSPSGISCGGTCEAEFDEGTVVTLNATPVAGSVFVGWAGGGCTGTAACTVTLAAAITVTASFEPEPPPTASTGEATEMAQTTVTLAGVVDGQGFDTHYLFEYGETASYGSDAPANNGVGEDAGVVATNTSETINVTGLAPNTTYHYKIVAYNIPCSPFCPPFGANTVNGGDRTFTTLPEAPAVITDPPVSVTPTSATVAGEVVPQCVGGRYPPTTYRFEYGTTTAYGTSSEEAAVAASSCATGGEAVTASLAGLLPNTVYHYRLDATNSGGETQGNDRTFTTNATGEPSSALTAGFSLTGTAPSGAAALVYPNLAGFAPMAPPKAPTPTTTKPLTRAQKLAKALKACQRKPKKQRAGCVKQAHTKYGAKAKKKK